MKSNAMGKGGKERIPAILLGETLTEVQTRYGNLSILEPRKDIVSKFLARYGEWAWDEAHFVASTLQEDGARVLDVGAFLGTFGLGVALQRRLAFVCFVEANSTVAPLLADNVNRSCTARSVVLDALAGWPGLTITSGRCEPGNVGASRFFAAPEAPSGSETIAPPRQIVTLPELRAEHGPFDLIKLDVEGMELEILSSDAAFLATGQTTIWVECNEDPQSLGVAELLLSWGLDLHYFAFPAHNPDNHRSDHEPIFPLAYEAGLLAAPKSPPVLDAELRAHRCILRPVTSVADAKQALWRTPRWGAREWVGATAEEVAALAGRQLRGERFETFLGLQWHPREVAGAGIWDRLEATERGLRDAEAMAFERLSLLETERVRADTAEARVAEATTHALDRLAELGAERERAAAADAKVAELEARLLNSEARLTMLEASTSWRITAPLRRFIDGHPHLHSLLRGAWRKAFVQPEPGRDRETAPTLETWRQQLATSISPRRRALDWAGAADESPLMPGATLQDALDGMAGEGLILCVSHDDYPQYVGGVQLLIGDEQRAFGRVGWHYLHVSPAAPVPILVDPTSAADFCVCLRLDGNPLGRYTFADLLGAIANCRVLGKNVEFVVHHLMGHVPELVLDLVRASGASRPVIWAHDFFTVCPSYTFLRNDVAFCGGPKPDSAACTICSYGSERTVHLERMRSFFEASRPTVLAPSEAALDLWRRTGDLHHAEAAVEPLARLVSASTSGNGHDYRVNGRLRVAFLGARTFHKGWSVFQELAVRLAGDPRYTFFQLGSQNGLALPDCIRNIDVRVDAQRRDAMIDAVAEARIDVVIIWSLWFETFSYAVHEALAGGAFVIARSDAGNVWPVIAANAPTRGRAVTTEAELFDLFAGGRVRELVNATPKWRGALLHRGGTVEWMLLRQAAGHRESRLTQGRLAIVAEDTGIAET